jgi:hypothetical protein
MKGLTNSDPGGPKTYEAGTMLQLIASYRFLVSNRLRLVQVPQCHRPVKKISIISDCL